MPYEVTKNTKEKKAESLWFLFFPLFHEFPCKVYVCNIRLWPNVKEQEGGIEAFIFAIVSLMSFLNSTESLLTYYFTTFDIDISS